MMLDPVPLAGIVPETAKLPPLETAVTFTANSEPLGFTEQTTEVLAVMSAMPL
jgi:hypothetical protein